MRRPGNTVGRPGAGVCAAPAALGASRGLATAGADIEHVSLGPATTPAGAELAAAAIAATQTLVFAAAVPTAMPLGDGAALQRAHDMCDAAAAAMRRIAHTTPHGIGNFRFACATANVPHETPYFPVAYARAPELATADCHPSGLRFAVGLENSALLVAAFRAARAASGDAAAPRILAAARANLQVRLRDTAVAAPAPVHALSRRRTGLSAASARCCGQRRPGCVSDR